MFQTNMIYGPLGVQSMKLSGKRKGIGAVLAVVRLNLSGIQQVNGHGEQNLVSYEIEVLLGLDIGYW